MIGSLSMRCSRHVFSPTADLPRFRAIFDSVVEIALVRFVGSFGTI